MSEPINPWDARFRAEDYVYGTQPNVFLSSMESRLIAKGKTLAIAEGEGRNAVFLAEKGFDVTAWDYAPSGIEKAQRLAKERGVSIHTELVDLQTAAWEKEVWDQIICVFGHFPPALRLQTLMGVREAVKPGGLYVSEVYSVDQLPYNSGGPKEKQLLYQPEEFLDVFKGWRFLHFFMGEVERHEGELHNGLSHVIQVVVQKPE